MDEGEDDVLAYLAFPEDHRVKLHITNGLERLNKEVKRWANVVGIFPSYNSRSRSLADNDPGREARVLTAKTQWTMAWKVAVGAHHSSRGG